MFAFGDFVKAVLQEAHVHILWMKGQGTEGSAFCHFRPRSPPNSLRFFATMATALLTNMLHADASVKGRGFRGFSLLGTPGGNICPPVGLFLYDMKQFF